MNLETVRLFFADHSWLTLGLAVPVLCVLARLFLHLAVLSLTNMVKCGSKTLAFSQYLMASVATFLCSAGLYVSLTIVSYNMANGKPFGLIFAVGMVGSTELVANVLILRTEKRKTPPRHLTGKMFPPLPD